MTNFPRVNERPYVRDGATSPKVNSTQMRDAMKLVYEHMLRINKATEDDLRKALDVFEAAYKNENWVDYVP